jgi:hypothetical protein
LTRLRRCGPPVWGQETRLLFFKKEEVKNCAVLGYFTKELRPGLLVKDQGYEIETREIEPPK